MIIVQQARSEVTLRVISYSRNKSRDKGKLLRIDMENNHSINKTMRNVIEAPSKLGPFNTNLLDEI